MSGGRSQYVIVYDVSQDKRRNKVAAVLEGHGERVQFSVFECLLEGEQFDALWKELEELLDGSDDCVRAYRICAACGRRTRTLGKAREVEVPEVYVA